MLVASMVNVCCLPMYMEVVAVRCDSWWRVSVGNLIWAIGAVAWQLLPSGW